MTTGERDPVVIAIDGVVRAPRDATIPVLDRGFLYGDSAFEVVRTYEGRPFALGEHLERLRSSCARIGIAPPPLEALRGDAMAVLDAGGFEESYLRLIVTRGVSAIGIGLEAVGDPVRVAVALPLPEQPAERYSVGVSLATSRGARALDGTSARGAAKASNYLPNILALGEARSRGAHESLAVGPAGEILEGATSNVFVVRDGVVRTPPLGVGILEGITRRVAIEAAESLGVRVEVGLLFPPDVYRADEVFITSTLREIVPAVEVDAVRIGGGAPGPVVARLRQAFRERVHARMAAEHVVDAPEGVD